MCAHVNKNIKKSQHLSRVKITFAAISPLLIPLQLYYYFFFCTEREREGK